MSTPMLLLVLVGDTLASGFVGWLLGRTARNAAIIAAEVVDQGDDGPVEPERARRLLARAQAQHVVMALLLVIGAVTALQGFVVANQQSSLVVCVAQYSDDLADALEQRSAPSQDVLAAQDRIWATVADVFAHPAPDAQDKIEAVIDNYNSLRAKSRKAQAENPLPDPPRGACAGLLR